MIKIFLHQGGMLDKHPTSSSRSVPVCARNAAWGLQKSDGSRHMDVVSPFVVDRSDQELLKQTDSPRPSNCCGNSPHGYARLDVSSWRLNSNGRMATLSRAKMHAAIADPLMKFCHSFIARSMNRTWPPGTMTNVLLSGSG